MIAAWISAASYPEGYYVSYSAAIYRALSTHSGVVTLPNADAVNWVVVANFYEFVADDGSGWDANNWQDGLGGWRGGYPEGVGAEAYVNSYSEMDANFTIARLTVTSPGEVYIDPAINQMTLDVTGDVLNYGIIYDSHGAGGGTHLVVGGQVRITGIGSMMGDLEAGLLLIDSEEAAYDGILYGLLTVAAVNALIGTIDFAEFTNSVTFAENFNIDTTNSQLTFSSGDGNTLTIDAGRYVNFGSFTVFTVPWNVFVGTGGGLRWPAFSATYSQVYLGSGATYEDEVNGVTVHPDASIATDAAATQLVTDTAAVDAAKADIKTTRTLLTIQGTYDVAAANAAAAAAQLATDVAAVEAEADHIEDGTTILGVAGTQPTPTGTATPARPIGAGAMGF